MKKRREGRRVNYMIRQGFVCFIHESSSIVHEKWSRSIRNSKLLAAVRNVTILLPNNFLRVVSHIVANTSPSSSSPPPIFHEQRVCSSRHNDLTMCLSGNRSYDTLVRFQCRSTNRLMSMIGLRVNINDDDLYYHDAVSGRLQR